MGAPKGGAWVLDLRGVGDWVAGWLAVMGSFELSKVPKDQVAKGP